MNFPGPACVMYGSIVLLMTFLTLVAIQAEVRGRETIGEWVRFTVIINTVYKRGKEKVARGEEVMWVRAEDIACKCPKIRLNRRYLILSKDRTRRCHLSFHRTTMLV